MLNECQRIWDYYVSIVKKDINMYNARRIRLRLPVLSEIHAKDVVNTAIDLIRNEPNVPNIPGPCIIIGDIQGNILDIIRYLKIFRQKKNTSMLFLGNLIGHGSFSYEIILLVMVLKNLFPNRVYFVRGSNEFESMARKTNLESSIQTLYGSTNCYNLLLEAFSYFPLCAVVAGRCYCVHGGIGPQVATIQSVNSIRRPIVHEDELVMELVYSSPIDTIPLFMPSLSENGYLFGETAFQAFRKSNGIQTMVRSHSYVPEGISETFNGDLITIYSASPEKTDHKLVGILLVNEDSIDNLTFPSCLPLLRHDITFVDVNTDSEWRSPHLGISRLPKLSGSGSFILSKTRGQGMLSLAGTHRGSLHAANSLQLLVPKKRDVKFTTSNAVLEL